jgi:hypothetical protein
MSMVVHFPASARGPAVRAAPQHDTRRIPIGYTILAAMAFSLSVWAGLFWSVARLLAV